MRKKFMYVECSCTTDNSTLQRFEKTKLTKLCNHTIILCSLTIKSTVLVSSFNSLKKLCQVCGKGVLCIREFRFSEIATGDYFSSASVFLVLNSTYICVPFAQHVEMNPEEEHVQHDWPQDQRQAPSNKMFHR